MGCLMKEEDAQNVFVRLHSLACIGKIHLCRFIELKMSLKDTKILKMNVMNNNMFVGGMYVCVNIDMI